MATPHSSLSLNQGWFRHSLNTAIAAGASLLLGRLLGLPEAFWAPISAIVVMQSTLGSALLVSRQRLVGTLLGALGGAAVSSFFEPHILIFALGIFLLGELCAIMGFDQSAYRFAGVTFAVIVLMARKDPAWIIGLHRCIEVSLGIAVSLLVNASLPGSVDTDGRQQGTPAAR